MYQVQRLRNHMRLEGDDFRRGAAVLYLMTKKGTEGGAYEADATGDQYGSALWVFYHARVKTAKDICALWGAWQMPRRPRVPLLPTCP